MDEVRVRIIEAGGGEMSDMQDARQLEDLRAANEWKLENLKGAVHLGGQTIKSLELVNGGAVIAILTFYGHLAERPHAVIDKLHIRDALLGFGIGVALAVLTSIMAYMSQLAAAVNVEKNKWLDGPGRLVALLLGVGSALLFVFGVISAAQAFQ